MANNIEEWRVIQFKDDIRMSAQYSKSKLTETMRRDKLQGKQTHWNYVGPVTFTQRLQRNSENIPSEAPRQRRMLSPSWYNYSEYFDTMDDVNEALVEPTGQLKQAVLNGAAAKWDEIVAAAYIATARTGEDGTGSEPFTTTYAAGPPIVPGVLTTGAVTGTLNVNHFIAARAQLLAADNDPEATGPWWFACHTNDLMAMLTGASTTSADYNSIKALVAGEIDTFFGFKIRASTKITHTTGAGGGLWKYAYTNTAMQFGVYQDIEVTVDTIPERHNSKLLQVNFGVAASRMDGAQFCKVGATSTAIPAWLSTA